MFCENQIIIYNYINYIHISVVNIAEEAENIEDNNSAETNIGHIVEGGMTTGNFCYSCFFIRRCNGKCFGKSR